MFKLLYTLKITTYSSEYLIDKLNQNNIICEHIEKTNDYSYFITIRHKYYIKFIKLFNNAILIKKEGLLFDLYATFVRSSTILSLIIFSLSLGYLNTLIYDIEVLGKNPFLSQKLVDDLKDYNIIKFKKIPNSRDLLIIKNELKNRYNQIENMELINVGTSIKLKYYLKEETINNHEINHKYYASKSGIIKSSFISRGNFLYSVNDYVKKGDLLIDDYVFINNKSIYVGAYGKVYAYTWTIVEINQISSDYNYVNSYADCLNKCRYEVSKNFDEDEYIFEEKVLISEFTNNNIHLKIHYTTVENIAKISIN